MHELSLASYLVESVEEQARQIAARRVLAVHLAVGERAGIDDSLRFYFERLTPGTLAEGASLHVRRTPMRFACEPCGSEYSPDLARADFGCPRCGTVGRLIDDASDLRIESLEIEE